MTEMLKIVIGSGDQIIFIEGEGKTQIMLNVASHKFFVGAFLLE